MTDSGHYQTAIEDRISFSHKLIYGFGAFVNNLLAAAIGGMVIVLNLGLGMNPALVGLLGALPRLTDAFTDPLMGYISDHTKSKWGRRRPYIFVGAIAAGIIFTLLWQLPEGKSEYFYFWYFLIGSVIFYLAYTVFATPWVALGYELTPDYLPANICDARVRAEEGGMDDAVDDLKALLFRNARNPELHFTLGSLYEKQQKFTEAAAEYRKAYELVSKHVEFE